MVNVNSSGLLTGADLSTEKVKPAVAVSPFFIFAIFDFEFSILSHDGELVTATTTFDASIVEVLAMESSMALPAPLGPAEANGMECWASSAVENAVVKIKSVFIDSPGSSVATDNV